MFATYMYVHVTTFNDKDMLICMRGEKDDENALTS
jgi:hypothetical protein